MDGLKRSLEDAIKEMQEAPVNSTSHPHPVGNVGLGAAQRLSPGLGQQVEPVAPGRSVSVGGTAHPAPNSIEAALASAPAVSPHYVPPPPPPPPVPTIAPQAPPPRDVAPRPDNTKRAVPEMAKQGRRPVKPATRTALALSAARQSDRASARTSQKIILAADGNELAHLERNRGPQATKLGGNNVWRWATICISCAGGLASGWLGSSMTGQEGSLFKSSVQTIVGEASKNATADMVPPIAQKFLPAIGKSRGSVERADSLTGKTDRAAPTDENLCTVLELNRGTGLTLAKPCKPIETAEFNSTLGKSDLLAKPRPQ